MLTENEVRRSVEDISRSEALPMKKVRGLLRLARALKLQARALHHNYRSNLRVFFVSIVHVLWSFLTPNLALDISNIK